MPYSTSYDHPIYLSGWMARKSVRLYVDKKYRCHYLAMLGHDPPHNMSLASVSGRRDIEEEMEEMEERGEGDGEGEERKTKGAMGGEEEVGDVEGEEVMGGEEEACTCTEAGRGRGCVDGEGVEGGGGGEAEGGAKGVWLDKESSQEKGVETQT